MLWISEAARICRIARAADLTALPPRPGGHEGDPGSDPLERGFETHGRDALRARSSRIPPHRPHRGADHSEGPPFRRVADALLIQRDQLAIPQEGAAIAEDIADIGGMAGVDDVRGQAMAWKPVDASRVQQDQVRGGAKLCNAARAARVGCSKTPSLARWATGVRPSAWGELRACSSDSDAWRWMPVPSRSAPFTTRRRKSGGHISGEWRPSAHRTQPSAAPFHC